MRKLIDLITHASKGTETPTPKKIEEGKDKALKSAYNILKSDAAKASEILSRKKEGASFTRSGLIWNTISLTAEERKLLNRRGIKTDKPK